jgi:hypothetical protein
MPLTDYSEIIQLLGATAESIRTTLEEMLLNSDFGLRGHSGKPVFGGISSVVW